MPGKEFTADSITNFVNDVIDGKVSAHLKSKPIPS